MGEIKPRNGAIIPKTGTTQKEVLNVDTAVANEISDHVDLYGNMKAQEKTITAAIKTESAYLKSYAESKGLNSIVGNAYEATLTETEKSSFEEDALINVLDGLGMKSGIVKTKKVTYVDYDALEDAIYQGKISAIELKPAEIVSTTVTLRIKKRKEK